MDSTAVFDIGMIAEDKSDARRAAILADRVLCCQNPWMDAENLDWYRRWRGLDAMADNEFSPGSYFLKVSRILKEAKKHPRMPKKLHQRGRGDVRSARSALILFRLEGVERVLWIRDSDDRGTEREGEIAEAVQRVQGVECAWGLPAESMESWVLAGFSPENPQEEEALEDCRKNLGFDPSVEPERLSHKEQHPKSSKKTVRALTRACPNRQDRCLRAEIEHLRVHGQGCGLTAFLDRLSTLFAPRPQRE